MPPRVVVNQSHILVEFWDSDKWKMMSERNKANRVKQNLLHPSRREFCKSTLRAEHHMQELLASQPKGSHDSTSQTDVYSQVMGPKRHGQIRKLGFGVNLTSVFGSSSIAHDEEVNDLKCEVK